LATGWSVRLGAWLLFILAIVLMPVEPGWRMAAVTIGYVAAFFALPAGFALRLLRWLRAVAAPSERMERIVGNVSQQMNTPVRRVWSLRGLYAQAFAMPMTGELIFSER